MSHALTRKCAHFFVRMFKVGPESLTTSELETVFCLAVTVISTLISHLDGPEPVPRRQRYQRQASIAPKKDTITFVPRSSDHTMFTSGVNRTNKQGLINLTQEQMKSEDTKKEQRQERIKQESFGFF